MKSVSEMPYGGRFMYNGMEMEVTRKMGSAVQARIIGTDIRQIFFGFEIVQPIEK